MVTDASVGTKQRTCTAHWFYFALRRPATSRGAKRTVRLDIVNISRRRPRSWDGKSVAPVFWRRRIPCGDALHGRCVLETEGWQRCDGGPRWSRTTPERTEEALRRQGHVGTAVDVGTLWTLSFSHTFGRAAVTRGASIATTAPKHGARGGDGGPMSVVDEEAGQSVVERNGDIGGVYTLRPKEDDDGAVEAGESSNRGAEKGKQFEERDDAEEEACLEGQGSVDAKYVKHTENTGHKAQDLEEAEEETMFPKEDEEDEDEEKEEVEGEEDDDEWQEQEEELVFFACGLPYTSAHLRRLFNWMQAQKIRYPRLSVERRSLAWGPQSLPLNSRQSCMCSSFPQRSTDASRVRCNCVCSVTRSCELVFVTERSDASVACPPASTGSTDGESPRHRRPLLVFFARERPGEAGSSWALQGLLCFLCSASMQAAQIRRAFEVVCAPMIAADGVSAGRSHSFAGEGLGLYSADWRSPCSTEETEPSSPADALRRWLLRAVAQGRRVACVLEVCGAPSGRRGAAVVALVKDQPRCDESWSAPASEGTSWSQLGAQLPRCFARFTLDADAEWPALTKRLCSLPCTAVVLGRELRCKALALEVPLFGLPPHRQELVGVSLSKGRYCGVRLGALGLALGLALHDCLCLQRPLVNEAQPAARLSRRLRKRMRFQERFSGEGSDKTCWVPWTPRLPSKIEPTTHEKGADFIHSPLLPSSVATHSTEVESRGRTRSKSVSRKTVGSADLESAAEDKRELMLAVMDRRVEADASDEERQANDLARSQVVVDGSTDSVATTSLFDSITLSQSHRSQRVDSSGRICAAAALLFDNFDPTIIDFCPWLKLPGHQPNRHISDARGTARLSASNTGACPWIDDPVGCGQYSSSDTEEEWPLQVASPVLSPASQPLPQTLAVTLSVLVSRSGSDPSPQPLAVTVPTLTPGTSVTSVASSSKVESPPADVRGWRADAVDVDGSECGTDNRDCQDTSSCGAFSSCGTSGGFGAAVRLPGAYGPAQLPVHLTVAGEHDEAVAGDPPPRPRLGARQGSATGRRWRESVNGRILGRCDDLASTNDFHLERKGGPLGWGRPPSPRACIGRGDVPVDDVQSSTFRAGVESGNPMPPERGRGPAVLSPLRPHQLQGRRAATPTMQAASSSASALLQKESSRCLPPRRTAGLNDACRLSTAVRAHSDARIVGVGPRGSESSGGFKTGLRQSSVGGSGARSGSRPLATQATRSLPVLRRQLPQTVPSMFGARSSGGAANTSGGGIAASSSCASGSRGSLVPLAFSPASASATPTAASRGSRTTARDFAL
eukprot:TRINITY_DN26101_c0_g1_i1.p1 TRINITY_DN26101_c0_g1~~TRINITY_DN26101_c0_g1_i1.p1  ORF type:complete len:1369 (-),score=196.08 TRINITY_DN26101_c0_g1_i1:38-3934(-)